MSGGGSVSLGSSNSSEKDTPVWILYLFPNSPSLVAWPTTAPEVPIKSKPSLMYNNQSSPSRVCRGHKSSHLMFSSFPPSVLSQLCVIANSFLIAHTRKLRLITLDNGARTPAPAFCFQELVLLGVNTVKC